MAVDPDDDALSWAGDDDVTPPSPRLGRRTSGVTPRGVADGSTVSSEHGGESAEQDQLGGERLSGVGAQRGSVPSDQSAGARQVPDSAQVSDPAQVLDSAPEGEPRSEANDDSLADDDDKQQLGSVALLAVGVLAGIYLLYTVGWVIGSGRVVVLDNLNPVEAFMAGLGRIFAIAAPAMWAAAVLWIGRRKGIGWRLAWAAVGVVLLVPWPFVMQA